MINAFSLFDRDFSCSKSVKDIPEFVPKTFKWLNKDSLTAHMQFDETPSSKIVESLKVFTFKDEETEDEIEVKIPEVVDPAYGMYVWPCAPVLAQYIWNKRKWICGKKVLELGAGTALPGVLAALCGAVVTLSDHSRYPRCLENCLMSCKTNDLEDSVNIVGLSWGEFSTEIFQLPTFDVLLASDCFYDSKGSTRLFYPSSFIY